MKNTVCFTGHRPNKLPGKYDWYHPSNLAMMRSIRETVLFLVEHEDINTFITGGALGVDQMAFKIVQKIKKENYPEITQILASPFKNQDGNWIPESKKLYNQILKDANKVIQVDTIPKYNIMAGKVNIGDYHPSKMYKRNEWMVDNSDTVIALYDGESLGGTKNCIEYAEKKDKRIIYINPNDFI